MRPTERSRSRGHDRADSPCRELPPKLLLEGIALFNRREFFECHEVLETLWRAERGAIRELYQGILQVGVGYHHLLRGNWWGAMGLLERGLARLRGVPPECQGVDVARLIHESERCRAELLRLGAEHVSAFDQRLIPQAHLGSETSCGNPSLQG